MTTIAYRDGIIAADTSVMHRGSYCGSVCKIAVSADELIVGAAAGHLNDLASFHNWLRGMNVARPFECPEVKWSDNFEALIIKRDEVWCWDGAGDPMQIKAPFHAIGSIPAPNIIEMIGE